MIRFIKLFGLLSMTLSGCAPSDDVPIGYDQVILLDVEGMYGGRDLWVDSDGSVIYRHVEPPERAGNQTGLQEMRYTLQLSKTQQDELAELIEKHAFYSITTQDRYGIPGEASPILFVKSGEHQHTVSKWANDKHSRFDAIYEYLLAIAEEVETDQQDYQGDHDWEWQPEGFPENETLYRRVFPLEEASSDT